MSPHPASTSAAATRTRSGPTKHQDGKKCLTQRPGVGVSPVNPATTIAVPFFVAEATVKTSVSAVLAEPGLRDRVQPVRPRPTARHGFRLTKRPRTRPRPGIT